ncbi:hypothetical protein CBL_01188 [Carabus blaptoides fortunei]
MVSYYNPMAMYRQQGPVGPTSGQFHNSGSPTAGWYGGYHHGTQVPTPQQYFNTMQDGDTQQVSWHHPHHSPQLPSPPMSSSELSSPGAPGGTVTPPNHIRPGPVRSPYDWINKPSYQSQPNPEIGTLSSAPLLLDFSPQDPSGTLKFCQFVYSLHLV